MTSTAPSAPPANNPPPPSYGQRPAPIADKPHPDIPPPPYQQLPPNAFGPEQQGEGQPGGYYPQQHFVQQPQFNANGQPQVLNPIGLYPVDEASLRWASRLSSRTFVIGTFLLSFAALVMSFVMAGGKAWFLWDPPGLKIEVGLWQKCVAMDYANPYCQNVCLSSSDIKEGTFCKRLVVVRALVFLALITLLAGSASRLPAICRRGPSPVPTERKRKAYLLISSLGQSFPFPPFLPEPSSFESSLSRPHCVPPLSASFAFLVSLAIAGSLFQELVHYKPDYCFILNIVALVITVVLAGTDGAVVNAFRR